ncbi:Glucokinase [hydrothermal vent metagenome]|uniref:Glucokinase n=1 Tax=hydrothermal vent metagenome TaxID=652676 RepID=A0A3B0TME5_9ZZZZ
MTEPVLVADIGGTNARFALAARDKDRIITRDSQTFRAEDFETIRDAADAYLEAVTAKPKAACFAVAGPVSDDVIDFTNSPWVLEVAKIKAALGLDRFMVANDFEALASSLRHLPKSDLVSVKPGMGAPDAPVLVIGPGTGLGQALVLPGNGRDRVIPTEGGHVGLAPGTDEEIEVMKFIAREHPRVSVERVLSGRGLVNIHRALCAIAGTPRVSLKANEITKAAMTKEYPIAVRAVEMFCGLLGAVAGDAVLATGARGGVVLGGGILPKIREIFLASQFTRRFLDKGRMRDYVERAPVDLIVNDGAALIGAAVILDGHSDAD